MTRPWPIGFVQMNSHKKTESSETSEMFIRWKKGSCELTHTGGLRVSLSLWFERFIPDISSRFPLADNLTLPGSESVFGLSQVLPHVCLSLSQDGV